jgi:hypothetical protein
MCHSKFLPRIFPRHNSNEPPQFVTGHKERPRQATVGSFVHSLVRSFVGARRI